jgi:PAS domain S-box-containing protein
MGDKMAFKTGKDKILIVDDQPEDIWPLSQQLQSGFDVLCVTSGKEALEVAFSENRPDLILLDIIMPGMDGYQVCEKLKADESTRQIPVIFLTGKTADPEQVKGLGLGAQDYITKPFSLPIVMARVKSVLNLKKEMDRRLLLKAQLEALNQQLERQVRQKQRELEAAREALKQYEDKWISLFKEEAGAKALKHILVVDDNPENVHILVNNLQSQYEVICTTSGKEALEIAFSDDRPDIILLDIMMPDMDGYEVCSRLKANAETWSIPVIFITALGQEVNETRGLNLGAVDFITKPFSIPVAKARIEAHLRLKEEMDHRITLARKLEELNKNLEARIQKKAAALEQAHEDLKSSESKYRGIYENAIEGIFQTTPEGRFLDASPSLARNLGYESSQELVATITDAAHQLYLRPQDRKIVLQALEQKGELFGFETQYKKKNGEVIWVLVSTKAIRDKDGELKYFQGFAIDITERKRAEEEISWNLAINQALSALFIPIVTVGANIEQISDIILEKSRQLTSSAHGFVAEIDPATGDQIAHTLTGMMHECKIVKKELRKIRFARRVDGLYNGLWGHALNTQASFYSNAPVEHPASAGIPEGHIGIDRFLAVPVLLNGESVGQIALSNSARDYTERDLDTVNRFAELYALAIQYKRAEEKIRKLNQELEQRVTKRTAQLEAVNKELEAFAYSVSHDLRAPLRHIDGFLELLQERTRTAFDDQSRHYIDAIADTVARMGLLIDNLLSFSRMGRSDITRQPVDLATVVHEVILELEPETRGRSIHWQVADLPVVTGDQAMLRMALVNLIANAVKFTKPRDRAEIEIGCQSGQGEAVVFVRDNGVGFDMAYVDKLFGVFQRLHRAEEFEGTGIGLANVRRIITRHGGRTWAEGKPDQGASFYFALPRTLQGGGDENP